MGVLSSDYHLWWTPVEIRRAIAKSRQDFLIRGKQVEVVTPFREHKLSRRLGEDQIAELIRRYNDGSPASALAESYGIGKSSVLRLLHERGVTLRPKGDWRH